MQKRCFKCGETKDENDFYRHPAMADGRLGKCKECTKADVRQNRHDRIDYYTQYEKKRTQLPERRAKNRQYAINSEFKDPGRRKRYREKYTQRYPERRAAHVLAGNAIRSGKLIPKPCEVCGAEDVEAHHKDYYRPLEVTWLCKKHHVDVHWRQGETLC